MYVSVIFSSRLIRIEVAFIPLESIVLRMLRRLLFLAT